jgi:uncharacterized protein involved in exopolysaccharide biosynthesis
MSDGGQMPFSIEDVTGALRRRWPIIALPTLFGLTLGGAVAFILPPTFKSTALILVESQQIPSDLARSTVTSDAPERIRLIEQRLMTRQNLLDVAERFRIFADRPDMSPTDVVNAMRAAMSIRSEVLATQGRGQVTASAVSVSFSASEAALAAQVANEFLTLLLRQNVQQRTQRAAGTLDFFNQEVERLGRQLTALEARITTFQSEHRDALPESLAFRRQSLAEIEQRMFERDATRLQLEEERRAIEQALAAGEIAALAGQGPNPQARELEALRQQLTQQRAIYRESHPVIRNLVSRIAAIEATLGATVDSEAGEGDAFATPVGRARRQIDLIDRRLTLLEEQQVQDSERREQLADSIERTPEVDIELSSLRRQQENIQIQYQQAVLKQAEAATGERLEVSQRAERFELIEPPEVPNAPDSPNRPAIIAAGFAGGMFLGVVIAALLELLNRPLRTIGDMERQLQLRPVVSIPYIRTARERSLRRWKYRIAFTAALAAAPISLYAIDQFVLPLPLAIEKAMTVSGLGELSRLVANRVGG